METKIHAIGSFVVICISLGFSQAVHAQGFPPGSLKNGCSISTESNFKSPKGLNIQGYWVVSHDNVGAKALRSSQLLAQQAEGLKKTDPKKSAELLSVSKLDLQTANAHRHRVFWEKRSPFSSTSEWVAKNPKFGEKECKQKVLESGQWVLNPKSPLRETCKNRGLDLPSSSEVQALLNCFRDQAKEDGAPGKQSAVDQKLLQQIIPPRDDLYFATKTINRSLNTEFSEYIFAFSPRYGAISETVESSDLLGISCVQNSGL